MAVAIQRAEQAAPAWLAAAPKTVLVLGAFPASLVVFRGPLLEAMVARGHRVIACASGASSAEVSALTAFGVEYCDVPFQRTGMSPRRDLATLSALLRLMRKLQPDVLLAYTSKPVVYGCLAARLAGVAAIFAMIEGVGYAFTSGSLRARIARVAAQALYRASLRGAQKVFFLNPDNRALFERLRLSSPRQAVLLDGIGIDLEQFDLVPFPERPAFLMIARLLRDKGVVEYVEAARALKRKYPEVPFRIVGFLDEHPMAVQEHELRAWVAEGAIEFLGRLEDVRPAIAACSVYVLPSYHEGLPRTVVEAMAMGRPIVTTDAPGCHETVELGENGWLVPVGDVPALTSAMESFLRCPDQIPAMGAASRRLAEAKYDVHKINAVMLDTMGLA